jgi:ParB-like chromosome segregation protein Spo0J
MSLEVVYLSPQALTPYEGNARKHNPEDIEQIKESILADGFNDPIGIWGEKNLIVEGHGRQIAAIELGLESVPCIRLDHLTDTQRRDYAIRHNRTAELSGWDFGKLEEEIARLEIEGVDLSGLKFSFNFNQTEDDAETPDSFKEYGEDTETKHKCPRCGYEWN